MAYVQPSFIYSTIRQNGCKYWTVNTSDGRYPLSVQEQDISADQSAQLLEDVLNQVSNGIITVECSEKSRSEKGRGGSTKTGNYTFKVNLQNGARAANESQPLNGIPQQDAWHTREQLIRLEETMKRQHLERKIDDLENGGALNGVLNNPVVQKAIPILLMKMAGGNGAVKMPPNSAPVNGLEDVEHETRIQNAVQRLCAIDPNFHEHIELLATFAEQKPEMYAGMIPNLKNMVDNGE